MVRFHVDCKCPLDAVFRRFIEEFEEWSSMNKHITRYKEILETVMKGLELLEMWEGTSCFNFFHYLRYGFQIRQLERETNSFLQDYSRHRFSEEVRHLLRKLNEHGQKYELGSMDESKMKETIFKHVSKLTNDPQQNAMILQHMCADNTFDGALVEVPCETISDYHKERPLKCLETSIDVLDEEARECFLDLGSFPEYRKICVAALLDIWVYVRKIEWWEAFVILLELASRNLLNLTGNPGNQAINSFEEFEEYLRQHDGKLDSSKMYFSQHDDVRDLALDMASGDPIVRRKRLFMPRKKESLPEDWELSKDQAFDAQIVSIHTGTIEKNQWCKMNFCEAEALVLLFSATNYSLPSFLSEMKKLKVLIIFSYGSKRATVKGLPLLSSLAQLKTIRLERLIVPPLQEHSKVLQNLEKVSLSLCEGLGNMSRFDGNQSNLKLPIMLDFNMDHCCDLEELPVGICDMSSVQKWSITNCHLLRKLPDDLGRLSSLRMLRISACLGLKELPASIGKLGKLEYMDISLCECLKELPEEIGQLKKLEELDMRECSRLRKLPKSVGGLKSLKHVICDEKIGQQWNRLKSFSATMDLRVEIVEAHFSLDWLDG